MVVYSFLLAFVGLVLVYIEFFLPGGLLAAMGALCMLAGFGLLGTFGPGYMMASIYLFVCLVLAALVCVYAIKRIKMTAKKDSFYLSKDQQGYVASSLDPALIGTHGVVVSDLKPSGHVEILGKVYQAVSQRGYILKEKNIKVIGTQLAYLIVIPSEE
ncbi:MAG: hypothetical protein FJZ57_03425 [Chlamydiae bacterium]|nr:hypothetical protein [Chlamydiota bacterium]